MRIDRARKWLLPQFDRSQQVKTDLRAYMAYALVLSGTRECDGARFRLEPALDAHFLRQGAARTGDGAR